MSTPSLRSIGFLFAGRRKSPSDKTELEQVDPKQAKCPRCGKELKIQEINPLATADSSTE